MTTLADRKARCLLDPLPKRLGALAADLARVASSAHHPVRADSVALLLEEGQHFIEWVATDTTPEIAAELVEIQIMLALWRRAWPQAQRSPSQRALLSFQAKKWSDKVLDFSGLLNSA